MQPRSILFLGIGIPITIFLVTFIWNVSSCPGKKKNAAIADDKPAAVSKVDSIEQVKIFFHGRPPIASEGAHPGLEAEVNDWLKQNSQIEILDRLLVRGDGSHLSLAIFYRAKGTSSK